MSVLTGQMDRALEQRLAALALANDVRSYRCWLKAELAAGRIRPIDVLRSTDRRLQSMPLREMLLAVPKVGRFKADRALSRSNLAVRTTIGRLQSFGPNRLADLVEALPQLVASDRSP